MNPKEFLDDLEAEEQDIANQWYVRDECLNYEEKQKENPEWRIHPSHRYDKLCNESFPVLVTMVKQYRAALDEVTHLVCEFLESDSEDKSDLAQYTNFFYEAKELLDLSPQELINRDDDGSNR